MTKITPKSITITRVEGPIHDCKTVTVGSWLHANAVLFQWSKSAPAFGGYDKCDFHIVFADGAEYDGRYDLMHHSREHPNLARHVRNFLRYLAGGLPKWCVKPEDIERVRRHQRSIAPEARTKAVKFLEGYYVGQI